MAPGAGDLHVGVDGDLGLPVEVAVDGVGALLGVARRLDHGGGACDEVAAGPDALHVGGVGGRVNLDATARNFEGALNWEEAELGGL